MYVAQGGPANSRADMLSASPLQRHTGPASLLQMVDSVGVQDGGAGY